MDRSRWFFGAQVAAHIEVALYERVFFRWLCSEFARLRCCERVLRRLARVRRSSILLVQFRRFHRASRFIRRTVLELDVPPVAGRRRVLQFPSTAMSAVRCGVWFQMYPCVARCLCADRQSLGQSPGDGLVIPHSPQSCCVLCLYQILAGTQGFEVG